MSYRRTLAAGLLTLIAVAVPSAAWFYAGSRQLARELNLREVNIYSKAQIKGFVHAERLATRLEILRASETDRAFYHYQNLFHDPEGASEGPAVTVSPLAKGSPDPYVKTYFQVDDDGRLTLPTINDEFPDIGAQSTDSTQCALLEQLSDVAYFCLGELDFEEVIYARQSIVENENPGTDGWSFEDAEDVELSYRAWSQNLDANALYARIKYHKVKPLHERPSDADTESVRIQVGPFIWHTLPVGEELGLVALRKVKTPVGTWTQGFVISLETVRDHLAHAHFPASFEPMLKLDRSELGGRRVHPVKGTPWGVAFDLSESLHEAVAEAQADSDRFYFFFLVGAISAAVAGLLVVTMVYQSERLALQRAQFAASAAHELRTPLAGLRLYGEMLAEGMGNPKKTRDYARRMAAEAERLGRVVTNVLSFTRLERKSLSVHPEPGDLVEAVQAAFRRQQPALREAGVEVDMELPANLPPLVFDRDAVSHIVQNLLDNAEKYTRGVVERKIEIRLEPHGSGAELSVADNGEGIPQDMRGRLFRAFARGDEHDAEGLGLGLVLVKALANAQGGEIRYVDRPAGGADFRVSFAGA